MALTLGLCCYIQHCHKSVMNYVTDITDGAADPESVPKIIKYISNTRVCMEIREWMSLKQHVCVCNPPSSMSLWSAMQNPEVFICKQHQLHPHGLPLRVSAGEYFDILRHLERNSSAAFLLPVEPFCKVRTKAIHASVELEEEEEAVSSSELW